MLEVTRDLLARGDAADVTIEAVAAAAGVSRPTIYRRWSNRAVLLFVAQTQASVVQPFPDTGSLRGDLGVACSWLASAMEQAERAIVGEQFGEMVVDRAFAEQVWATRWNPDRETVYPIWQRALDRGEVDTAIDGRAVIDDLVAVFLFRIYFSHQQLSEHDVAAIVDRVLDGVIAQPPSQACAT